MKKSFIRIVDGGICAVDDVKAAGLKNGKYGLTIIKCENSIGTGLFTSNKVKAAPVIYTKKIISDGEISIIVANSGNANCFTGPSGMADCDKMVELTSKLFSVPKNQRAIASTGVIGRTMPMDIILPLIEKCSKNLENSSKASKDSANAILTTDFVSKEFSVEVTLLNGKIIKIGGIAKGSGMIAPNMATMLCFLTTDAYGEKDILKKALKEAVDLSFNMVVVDGDESTNDEIILLGSKNKDNSILTESGGIDSNFQEALNFLCQNLAKMMAKDGEGATKFIEVHVFNGKSQNDVIKASKSIVSSSLVKTAVFGGDPNWGRIVSAIGYSGADFNPNDVSISVNSKDKISYLVKNGEILGFEGTNSLKDAEDIMQEKEIKIIVDLNNGSYEATAYGCDFSYDYVKINAEYTT
ncbi:MAG: bifunctional ornithine acetyltransferase/N-acetylglutamate synthase [Methanobrevibacter sp.]|jgi:glutamate N-acetyltransferase/amino-acid N-acetyltransferase|nr:bifunctional ornithine acetyltransferase/N-acetylglutamate synthase [Methanobrevibacter sp.]